MKSSISQYSRKDDKTLEKRLPKIFWCKSIPKYNLTVFLRKVPAGILGKLSSFSASYSWYDVCCSVERSFRVLRRPKTNLRSTTE